MVPAYSLRGWEFNSGWGQGYFNWFFFVTSCFFFIYTSLLRESGTLEWSCKRKNLALICRIFPFTAQFKCLDSPPLPATMMYKRSEKLCTELAKKGCPSLHDSACWCSGEITQPRANFFGQLCKTSLALWNVNSTA